MRHPAPAAFLAAALLTVPALEARADVVIDWNLRANEVVVESKIGTPPAMRVMAIVQTAVHEAVVAAPRRARRSTPPSRRPTARRSPSCCPRSRRRSSAPTRPRSPRSRRAPARDRRHRSRRESRGRRARRARRRRRRARRPPTARTPAPAPTCRPPRPRCRTGASRKPWLMSSPSQFRPAPPPALGSDAWVRDYNEVKLLGAKASTARTPEQTEIAQFWEYSLPPIYHGVVRSVAAMPGRTPRRTRASSPRRRRRSTTR